ncbi:MAG: ABC transporter permease subunit, partial [Planctomycetes bacterium]|nr:ABC transporter permease subunit [Planctomycetota bacterium]
MDTGRPVLDKQLYLGRKITACSFSLQRDSAALGFSDGSIALLSIGFETSYYEEKDVPQDLRDDLLNKPKGSMSIWDERIFQITPEDQYRGQSLRVVEKSMVKVADHPIERVDLVERTGGPLICAVTGPADAPGFLALSGRDKEDFLTGEMRFAFDKPVPLPWVYHSDGLPVHLEIAGTGADIYLAWEDGWFARIHAESLKRAFIAEQGRLVEPGERLTAMGFLLGETTLFWGDSRGRIQGGFPLNLDLSKGPWLQDVSRDPQNTRSAFTVTKTLRSDGAPLCALTSSSRSRLLACGFSDGTVEIYNPTQEALLASLSLVSPDPIKYLALMPKENGLIAVAADRAVRCRLDPGYPEAGLKSLFLAQWYEGYPEPMHMWQSSGGNDDFEPKLGLVPLIFGTLKATLFAMLFGAPLALLAAVYSSEFLRPRVKRWVKPAIELMASLPSVVLGFLGALVFAPYVEKYLAQTISMIFTVPFALACAAYFWQLLPGRWTRRWEYHRLFLLPIPLIAGVAAAFLVGPLAESCFFSGDLIQWLSQDSTTDNVGSAGSGVGGWLILWLPVSVLLTGWIAGRWLLPWVQQYAVSKNDATTAALELGRFFATTICAVAGAFLLAGLCNALGWDPRADWTFMSTDWSLMDTYVQRNALIVGFVMGFAVIPIIYTIADDALSAVPDHLRSASLGAGATPWQTARRIVIPTAASGLFSAVMVGLGRAVGETMIVLMALGNTAIMDWNLFNGARTLSANIAVELPEAVRNSTHYRTLFLAALVLFAMTFVINSVAEAVRLRFRKRAC